MHHLEIWQTINESVREALLDELHERSEAELLRYADEALSTMPIVGSTQPTGGLLLRRYRPQLRRELCRGGAPRSHYEVIEDEVRDLTRAVMLAMDNEGIPIDAAVMLALAIRARGVEQLCAG